MKNKMVFLLVFFLFPVFLYSGTSKIKKIEIFDDDFCFDVTGYSKSYEVLANLEYLDVALIFSKPIQEANIELGILEVELFLNDGESMNFSLESVSKIFYKNFGNKIVYKVYLTPINLKKKIFVREINFHVQKSFDNIPETSLLLTNSGSRFVFDY